jgi:hypothetical protein
VEELVAVTVAPGIGVFPDFTTPVMEKAGAAGASCASELVATSSRSAMRRRATTHVLEPTDVGALEMDVARLVMLVGADQLREALIHSTPLNLPNR